MKKRVAFRAQMKELKVKALESLDKGGRLVLDFNAVDDKLIADMNGIMKADKEVFVVLMEQAEGK